MAAASAPPRTPFATSARSSEPCPTGRFRASSGIARWRSTNKIGVTFRTSKVVIPSNRFKQFSEPDEVIPRVGTLNSTNTPVDAEECELVLGKELELGNNSDSTVHAQLSEAVKNKNGASVLLLTDVYGYKNPDTRDFAYRLACMGYSVLVPDLFRGFPWKPSRPESQYEEWRSEHPTDRVLSDINTAIKYLASTVVNPEATPGQGRVAVVGFCYGGGRLIEVLASKMYGFSTGVVFYGTRFDPDLASKIDVPLLLITGDSDPKCSVETMQRVARNVKGSKLLIYPGCAHAFAHHPKTLEDDEAADDAFLALKQWFQYYLLNPYETY